MIQIKKGNKYKCISWEGSLWSAGKIYVSVNDNYLMDNYETSSNVTLFRNVRNVNNSFEKVPSHEKVSKKDKQIKELTKLVYELFEAISVTVTPKKVQPTLAGLPPGSLIDFKGHGSASSATYMKMSHAADGDESRQWMIVSSGPHCNQIGLVAHVDQSRTGYNLVDSISPLKQ